MKVLVRCPQCQTAYRVPRGAQGKSGRCKECGARITLKGMAADTKSADQQATSYSVDSDLATVEIGTTPTMPSAPPGSSDASIPPCSPSQKLGRFELKGRLGEGAYGVVYRAYDPTAACKFGRVESRTTKGIPKKVRSSSR